MASNILNRYVWLIDIINRHGYITLPEIDRAWQRSSLNADGQPMPERTFFNHRNAIRDLFGIEIKNDRNLGYYIADTSELSDDVARTWLLQTLSVGNALNECIDMKGRILVEKVPSNQMYLTDIISAMKNGRSIFLTYHSFKDSEPHTFETEPYCIKLFRQRWYMLGRLVEKNVLRVYSLDRIADMEESDNYFELPKGFDGERYFSNYFGIITAENAGPEDVYLRVNRDQVKYFRTLPLHTSQAETEANDEYSIFHYALVPTFDFYQEILSKGSSVEVLSPSWLREWVSTTASQMCTNYSRNEEH